MPIYSICSIASAAAAICTIGTIFKGQVAQFISRVQHSRVARRHLAGRARVARRNVHDGVVLEKVARLEQQCDGLDGHDGEILGRRDVYDAKGVPQDNVGVVDGLCAVADPFWKT